jgi:hypothetical protein
MWNKQNEQHKDDEEHYRPTSKSTEYAVHDYTPFFTTWCMVCMGVDLKSGIWLSMIALFKMTIC